MDWVIANRTTFNLRVVNLSLGTKYQKVYGTGSLLSDGAMMNDGTLVNDFTARAEGGADRRQHRRDGRRG